ncbi:hypothetical protein B0H13DRAFT_2439933 [Mycena leptocephala]|nr:hypothetical protein B0H13DRAFT_2439933 [Mycena leptocephala]
MRLGQNPTCVNLELSYLMTYDFPVVLGPNFTISFDIYTAHRAQFRLERTAKYTWEDLNWSEMLSNEVGKYRGERLRDSCAKPKGIKVKVTSDKLLLLLSHTHKEYITFKAHTNHTKFRTGTKVYPPHEHWKNIDFLKFAQFWNELVDAQPRSVTDSNLRLYYKLPQQLEAHHKKTILWKSECATLSDGSYNDPTSFNPMAEQPAQGEAGDSEFPSRDHEFPQVDHLDELDSESALEDALQSIPSQPMQSASEQHTYSTAQSIQSIPIVPAMQQTFLPCASAPAGPKSKTKTRRCALCAKAECNKWSTCPGSGKQSLCMCGHPPLNGKKVRVSEATLIARLQRQSLGQS